MKPRVKATKMWAYIDHGFIATCADRESAEIFANDNEGVSVARVTVLDSRDYRDLLRDAKAWRAMQAKKATYTKSVRKRRQRLRDFLAGSDGYITEAGIAMGGRVKKGKARR